MAAKPRSAISKAYRAVLDEHRARLSRLTTKTAIPQLKRLYDQAHDELAGKLRRTIGNRKDTFTAHQHRLAMGQIKQAQILLARRATGQLGDLSEQAQVAAVRGTVKDVRRLEKTFTGAEVVLPIEQAARFRGIIDKRRTSLLKMHKTSLGNYGLRLVTKMQDELSLSMMLGENASEAIDRVAEAADLEWWQGERIVRTEMAWAYNASHHDSMQASAKELPDLMMRWNELVDDDTGAPLDDRVAVDSLAIHGQVARPGELFTMPAIAPMPDAKGRTAVPDSLVGEQWRFPPNRPNDRASLSPWRPSWGIPGWRYVGGRRVNL